jgi:hypothetical protein
LAFSLAGSLSEAALSVPTFFEALHEANHNQLDDGE